MENGILIFILGYGALMVVAWALLRLVRGAAEKRWQALASELGLDFSQRGRALCLDGALGGFAVRVVSEYEDHENRIVHDPRIQVTLPEPIPGLTHLGPREWEADARLTGDDAFDDLVRVEGDPEAVRALLTPELRQAIRELSTHPMGTPVVRGTRLSYTHYHRRAPLGDSIRRTVALAEQLTEQARRAATKAAPPA